MIGIKVGGEWIVDVDVVVIFLKNYDSPFFFKKRGETEREREKERNLTVQISSFVPDFLDWFLARLGDLVSTKTV